jgi:glycosyltransferase involved in cell wall biosynthesis
MAKLNIHLSRTFRNFFSFAPVYPGWPYFPAWQRFDYSVLSEWPRLTIITPSYNQGKYLEQTVLSVIGQNYPNLEYILVDGNSTDNSIQVIKKYEHRFTWWVSEPDGGQSNAINKGMALASGEWVAWLNSDDLYLPNALGNVMLAAVQNPPASWIVGNTVMIKKKGHLTRAKIFHAWQNGHKADETNPHPDSWLDFICTKWSRTWLPQQSSFWKRSIWSQVGGLDEQFHLAMDHELYGRFARLGYRPLLVKQALAIFRIHEEQKSARPSIFIPEEIQTVDKWLAQPISLEDRETLIKYKNWLASMDVQKLDENTFLKSNY